MINELKEIEHVCCGFNKWEIGIEDQCEPIVYISANYHPIYMDKLRLYDISISELRALGKMFFSYARKLEEEG